MTAVLFRKFLSNLAVGNRNDISISYNRITRRLNDDFWNLDSETAHSLQVGSFGRGTAIHGISDLDMVFELPPADFIRFDQREGNGQSAMLQEVRDSLLTTLSGTKVRGDGPVVVVPLNKVHFEVLPAFRQADGSYKYGITSNGGSWAITNPRAERDEFQRLDDLYHGNLKSAARMMRAWKNSKGVAISGWLIDTLAAHFFADRPQWREATLNDYADLVVDMFDYLAGLDDNGAWRAPGSGAVVASDGRFTRKARDARDKSDAARRTGTLLEKSRGLRSVFGRPFPLMEERYANDIREVVAQGAPKEEFIEDKFAVDIRYDVRVDYEITENNRILFEYNRQARRARLIPPGRGVRFFIADSTVPNLDNAKVYWKIKNRGATARRRAEERGELWADGGQRERQEHSLFDGDHYVEVYVVQNGVCVARDRAPVKIVD